MWSIILTTASTVILGLSCITPKIEALRPYPITEEIDIDNASEGKYYSQDSKATPASPFISCDFNCYDKTSRQNLSSVMFICGSDGFTYLNFEELDCVRKSCAKNIHFHHFGRCPRTVTMDFPNQYQQNADTDTTTSAKALLRFLAQPYKMEVVSLEKQSQSGQREPLLTFPTTSSSSSTRFRPKFQRQGKKICLPDECGCSEEFRPICGSDSVTYGNECLLKCNQECHPNVIKSRDGQCGHEVFEKTSCVPDKCGCPDDFQPICGSDNITYGNRCLLECNKNCDAEIAYDYKGYCGRLFFPTS